MIYLPQVNDYVKWEDNLEGWVYFKCENYITIEQSVQLKSPENYQACPLHRNERLLVLCYQDHWNELERVGYRKDKYSVEILKTEESENI
jgi:hypothetical protein